MGGLFSLGKPRVYPSAPVAQEASAWPVGGGTTLPYAPHASPRAPAALSGCHLQEELQAASPSCKSRINESQESAASEQPLLWGFGENEGD